MNQPYYSHCMFEKDWEKMKLNEPGTWKTKIRNANLLTAASMAILWPTLGLRNTTFDNSGFSAKGHLISASAVPDRGV